MNSKGMKTKQLDQMQFLRTLAFFNIFMLHAGHWNFFNYPGWYGAISAVSFFFMLSGFLVGYSFDMNKVEELTFGCYMRRKIIRFYPLYAFTTIFAIPISGLPQALATGNPAQMIEPVVQLGKNLLCVQSWFPDGFLSYNGPCWFSATLLFLTALNLPFLRMLTRVCKKEKKGLCLLAVSALCFLSTVLYCYVTGEGSLQYLHYILPVSRVGIYLGSMALGVMLRPHIEGICKKEGCSWRFTALEIGALAVWVISLRHPGPEWMEWNCAWILPNLLVLTVFCFGKGWVSSVFSSRGLVKMGNVTFECYLIHSLIIPFYSSFNKFDTTYTLGCLFSLVICLMLTYLAAWPVHKYLREKR